MSEGIAQFHFLRPAWLLLVPVVLVVAWFWKRRTDPLRGWRGQIAPQLLKALVARTDTPRAGRFVWLPAAWVTAIIAIAGPTWKPAPSPFADDAAPLMILLKADSGMTVADPAPSRLERSRVEIDDLISHRQGQPLGLIAYAGSAHLVLPPTRDTAVVGQMARDISPDIMPVQGDRLDLALLEARRVLTNNQARGSVLVLADSIDTDLETLAGGARAAGLPVQVLAVSSPGSSEASSLQKAADRINAPVQLLAADESDTMAIIRRAARAPVLQSGTSDESWQEAGYFLVPLVAWVLLMTFRREAAARETPR